MTAQPDPTDPGAESERPSGEIFDLPPEDAFPPTTPIEPLSPTVRTPDDLPDPAPGPAGWLDRFSHPRALQVVGLVSLLLLAGAGIAAWYLLNKVPLQPGVQANVTPPASLSELSTEFPEMASVLNDPSLGSVYKDFLLAYQEGGLDAAYALAEKRNLLNANGDVRLTLELDTTDTQALQAQLETFGVAITAQHGNEIDIAIPRPLLEQLVVSDDPASLFEDLSGLEHITRIRLPLPNVQDDEGVQTESLPVIGANAWQAAGITGKGVKVGILDRGFDTYQKLLGTDLPAQVTVRSFIAGVAADGTGSVHGAAVAEIVHDIAPDAELFFAAYDTDAEERVAIDWLVAQGVRIISHSASSIYGPMNGSGWEATYVDQMVSDGIVWVNSAGNYGYTHYRGTFTDTDGDGYHEFAPGDEMMDFIPDGKTIFVLNWDDWGRGLEDFDLYLLDANGNEFASSTDIQDGPEDDAAEGLVYNFSDSKVYYLAFYAKRTSRPVVFDFFMTDGQIEYYTPEHSVTTPGDARLSLTVGATNWSDDQLEKYSSQGPTNDGRLKPDLAAPAGVSSAAYGTTWIGTSASTPHVSGAAALVLQAFPSMSPTQVADFLRQRSVDLGPSGPDNAFGTGRLYLGEPPALSPVEPVPGQETPTLPPPPTFTPPATAEASIPPATPSPTAERVVLTMPTAGENNNASLTLVIGLLACVAAPGLLGLGGVGLFAAVWYMRRPQPAPPGHRARPASWAPPAAAHPARSSAEVPAPAPANGEAKCPRCGTPHRPGARFCSSCGQALDAEVIPLEEQVFCTNCGKLLRTSSKFCPYCGHQKK